MTWKEGEKATSYYEVTQHFGPHEETVRASLWVKKRPAQALDVGCGAFPDTRYLLSQGFRVTAIDGNDVRRFGINFDPKQFSFHQTRFQDFNLPRASIDFVNARDVLSYNPKPEIVEFISNLKPALNQGAIVYANVLSLGDSWNKPENADLSFFSQNEIIGILLSAGFLVPVVLEEVHNKGTAAGKPKNLWHNIHFVARNGL